MRYYLAAAAALALQATAAHAETITALIGNDVLATIDSRLGKTTGWTKIEGIGPVVGIDIRPSDGQLYALTSDGIIATVDPASGQATSIATLEAVLREGVKFSVDFNPVADKMRVIGSDGTNLRVNVVDGAVTMDKPLSFAETDPASGSTPMVIAGAYANSVKDAKETTLYDIDAGRDGLFRQAPPNDGVLSAIGTLGLDADHVAFDIATDSSGVNTAMLLAKGTLYAVDLTSGKALTGKAIAKLPSDVRDIAILPAMQPKQAAASMMPDAVPVKGDTTASYLPKPEMMTMSPSKPKMQMKTGYKARYRDDHGMKKGVNSKTRRGNPKCERDDDY